MTCPLLLLSEWLSESSRRWGSRLECLLGGVWVLVGPPVFKTGVSSVPAQAGSIPVRLRDQRFRTLALAWLWTAACLLARGVARFYPLRPFQRGKH